MDIDGFWGNQSTLKDERWFATLDARKKEEASFHDYVRSKEGGLHRNQKHTYVLG